MSRENRRYLSWPSPRLVASIVALWFVAAVPGLAVLVDRDFRLGAFGEALSYLILALVLASVTPLRAVFAQLSRPLGAVLVAGAVLMLFGQLGGGGRHVFPLVRFNVYTDPVGDAVSFTKLEGVTRAGDRVLVYGDDVFHALKNGRFRSFHSSLLRATGLTSGRATDGRHDSQLDDYRRFLLGVLRQYNDEHEARPLVALEVVEYHGTDVPDIATHRHLTSKLLLAVNANGTFTIPAPSSRHEVHDDP